jgi:hypothetical protein
MYGCKVVHWNLMYKVNYYLNLKQDKKDSPTQSNLIRRKKLVVRNILSVFYPFPRPQLSIILESKFQIIKCGS